MRTLRYENQMSTFVTFEFDCGESRYLSGFSRRFIECMQVYKGERICLSNRTQAISPHSRPSDLTHIVTHSKTDDLMVQMLIKLNIFIATLLAAASLGVAQFQCNNDNDCPGSEVCCSASVCSALSQVSFSLILLCLIFSSARAEMPAFVLLRAPVSM